LSNSSLVNGARSLARDDMLSVRWTMIWAALAASSSLESDDDDII